MRKPTKPANNIAVVFSIPVEFGITQPRDQFDGPTVGSGPWVLEESSRDVKIVVDPIANCAPVVIDKGQIDNRRKQMVSIMPAGLLNKFSREEILDLVASVVARGDQEHQVFTDQ